MTTSRTWTDDDIDRIMKQVGPAAANLPKLIDAKEAPAAEAHADTLQYYFDDVEEFFDARKMLPVPFLDPDTCSLSPT